MTDLDFRMCEGVDGVIDVLASGKGVDPWFKHGAAVPILRGVRELQRSILKTQCAPQRVQAAGYEREAEDGVAMLFRQAMSPGGESSDARVRRSASRALARPSGLSSRPSHGRS